MAKLKGNVYQIGPSWRVKYPLGKDPTTGKYRTIQETYPTEGAANERLARLRVEELDGKLVTPSKMTVAQFSRQWLAAKRGQNIKPSAVRTYRNALQSFIRHSGAVPIAKIDASRILAWRGTLLTEPYQPDPPRYYSISTVHLHQTIVAMMFSDAVRWKILAANPCEHVALPEVEERTYTVWNRSQIETFLSFCETRPDGAFWRTMLTTGLRIGEMVALRWDDLFGNKLSVRETASSDEDGRLLVGSPKSKHSRRTITLSGQTVAALNAHRAVQRAYREKVGPWWNEDNWMFPSRRGTMQRTARVRERFPAICAAAGLPVIRPHDLRHSNANDLMRAKVPPRVVQQRLGHYDVAFTLRRYSHPDEDMDVEAAETFERTSEPRANDDSLRSG